MLRRRGFRRLFQPFFVEKSSIPEKRGKKRERKTKEKGLESPSELVPIALLTRTREKKKKERGGGKGGEKKKEKFGYDSSDLKELVGWADIIDGASLQKKRRGKKEETVQKIIRMIATKGGRKKKEKEGR